jgi:hypothetical protein
MAEIVDVDDDLDRFQTEAVERGWSDGLPVIPPTPERVERMLSGTDRDPAVSLMAMAPSFGECTIEKVAIAAVMAGCLPEYMPVLVAIVEAAARPQFNMLAIQTTTHPCGIMAIVNGPIARAVGLNGSSGALGPGYRANSTIGRAVRLVQQNIGGAVPGRTDLATQGSPLKFGLCFAENAEASPWEPYHVSKGYAAEESVVTIQAAEAPNAVKDHMSRSARQLLMTLQQSMAIIGKGNAFQRNLECTVGLGPEHAAMLHAEGMTRADLQTYLYERARIPYRAWALGGGADDNLGPKWTRWADEDAYIPMSSSPDRIHVYVVGGPGKHSVWSSGSGASQIVSQRVEMADGSPWMPT